MDVTFEAKYPWAVLPYKTTVDQKTAKADAAVYEHSFRWLRKGRVAPLCWPWRLGQEIGWTVPSPVDVEMSPLEDVEVWCPEEEMGHFGSATGHSELWRREDNFLALKKSDWLRLYEVRFADGWEMMFVPNGEGTVEWHLGWGLDMPPECHLMIFPTSDLPELEVPVGVLNAAAVSRMNGDRGLSVAVRPRVKVRIRRRQPIARALLVTSESVRAKAKFREYADGTE